jgi:hypothetical protein
MSHTAVLFLWYPYLGQLHNEILHYHNCYPSFQRSSIAGHNRTVVRSGLWQNNMSLITAKNAINSLFQNIYFKSSTLSSVDKQRSITSLLYIFGHVAENPKFSLPLHQTSLILFSYSVVVWLFLHKLQRRGEMLRGIMEVVARLLTLFSVHAKGKMFFL